MFGNGGKCVMTNTVFPENPYTTLILTSEGRARINGLKIYSVK
ncbi:MAG: GH32 C-terminal domain-containing protein [Muribaculaceae bacterium]